jgi:RNA polymerase sigma-70 factor, ECF subfamily
MYSPPRLSGLTHPCVRPQQTSQLATRRNVPSRESAVDAAFGKDLVGMIPFLEAFSRKLCRDYELAKDLAQETLSKAWSARASFRPGTNLKAWLCKIARNELHSHHRRSWRQSNYDEDQVAEIPGPDRPQFWSALGSDTVRALNLLPPEQRQGLLLVTVGGLSYADAAPICGCLEGTLKSRVARGRRKLLAALDGDLPSWIRRPPPARAVDELIRALKRVWRRSPSRQQRIRGLPAPLSKIAA